MSKNHGVIIGIVTVALLLAASTSTSAENLNKKLIGDYATTYDMSCAFAYGGFTPELTRIGPGSSYNVTVQGVSVYDGEGSFTLEGEVLVIRHDPTQQGPGSSPVDKWALSCTGVYDVKPDMTAEQSTDCTVTLLAGGTLPIGTPVNILNGSRKLRLFGAERAFLILAANTDVNVETMELPIPVPLERICGISGVLMKIWH